MWKTVKAKVGKTRVAKREEERGRRKETRREDLTELDQYWRYSELY